MLAICRESARETDKKCCFSECARPSGLRRLGGDCVSSQLPLLPSKKGSHRRRTKRNYFIERRREFGFWIDEPTKIVTFADGKKFNVRRFDDHWISAVSGDVSYELDRQNGKMAASRRQ